MSHIAHLLFEAEPVILYTISLSKASFMFLRKFYKLLPKRLVDRVALKTLISQHQLLKFKRGFKKLTIFSKLSIVSKITSITLITLFLTGYQPVLALPPIQKSIARADFTQDQQIETGTLSEAFSLPHPGYLTTPYSTWHPGVDIATGLGMPIHPILKGKVIEINYGFFGYGNQVTVEHEQGYKSIYSHMGRIYTRVDDLVHKSSILGEVGLTGRTTGPHTHLEIKKDDKYIDPANILPKIPDFGTYAKSVH